MKKLRIIAILTVFSMSGAMAQLMKIDQEVFGMDCAPCAYGLERGLKKMEGLKNVRVSLNEGKAYLNLASGNTLTLQKIQEEVKSNGFSARNAEVVLKGELQQNGNDWQIKVNNETFQITSDTDGKIISILKPGPVRLMGVVKDQEDKILNDRWEIRVTEVLDET